jgi:hypothetical protein
MTVAIIAIIAVVLVLVVGLLIFRMMRRSQDEVPAFTDARAAQHPQVVGTDEQGDAILDTDEPETAQRDEGAFENLLRDEIHDQGREQPVADDET